MAGQEHTIKNRRRLGAASKLSLAWLALRQNGLIWFFMHCVYYLSSGLAEWALRARQRWAAKHNLPGLHSPELNKAIWQAWDWSAGGEEWTGSEDWKRAVVEGVMNAHAPHAGTLLEIGPGAGRWTEHLQGLGHRLIGVDISPTCVETCRDKFPQVDFYVTDGCELPQIQDASVDFIWSFDVFVHVNQSEVARYVQEFHRVLKPGGTALIHHGRDGGVHFGSRSDLTADGFVQMLRQQNLTIIRQFDSWQWNDRDFRVGPYDDMITVFQKTDRVHDGGQISEPTDIRFQP